MALSHAAWAQDGDLPDIEARLYRVKTETVSKSGSVYLLKRLAASKSRPDAKYDSIPAERKLLVLKKDEDNVMALRVLKDLPETDQIIAKRIRIYQLRTLPMAEEYVAVEKIADVLPPPPTEQDKKDMEEVAPPAAYDPELDAGTSPDPNMSTDDSDDDEKILGRAVDENEHLSFRHHWVSIEAGLFSNLPTGGLALAYYTSGGIRYQYDFAHRLAYREGKAYDTLGIEGGVFFYKIVNLNSAGGDAYTIVPLSAVLRYSVFPTDTWGYSFYGGLEKNSVISHTPPTNVAATDPTYVNTVNSLGSFIPAFGVGGTYHLGPGWYVRADIGIDMLAVGLALHF